MTLDEYRRSKGVKKEESSLSLDEYRARKSGASGDDISGRIDNWYNAYKNLYSSEAKQGYVSKSDAQKYRDSVTSARDRLARQAGDIERSLWENKATYGADKVSEIVSSMDAALRSSGSLSSFAKQYSDYYSQFENEAAYNYIQDKNARASAISGMTADELDNEIARIQSEYKKFSDEKGGKASNIISKLGSKIMLGTSGANNDGSYNADIYKAQTQAANDNISALDNYKSELSTLENEKYNRTASEKLSQLNDEAKQLLDRYNASRAVGEASRFASVSGTSTYMAEYENSVVEQYNIEKQFEQEYGIDKDEFERLSEYRGYQKSQEESFASATGKAAYDFSAEHPVLGSALSVALAPVKGIGAIEIAKSAASKTDRPIDTESLYFAPTRMTDSARQGVTDTHDWHPFNSSRDWFDELYSLGMSTADSLVAMAIGGKSIAANRLILGSQAAMNATLDAVANGTSKDNAIMTGVAAGITEALFEGISIGQFKSMAEKGISHIFTKEGIKTFAKNILKSTVTNASEEANTELANTLFDYLSNGGASSYAKLVDKYMSAGDTEAVARQKAASQLAIQVGEAGLGGALQGIFMGGLSNTVGAINAYEDNKQLGKALKTGNMDEIAADALNYDSTKKLAEKYQSGKLSDAKTEQLYEQYLQTKSEIQADEWRKSISEQFTANGETPSEALVNGTYKSARGEQLTARESLAVQNSDNAFTVINQLKSSNADWINTTAQKVGKMAESTIHAGERKTTFTIEEGEKIASPNVKLTDGTDATVKGVSSVGKNSVVLKLDDGTLARAEDVQFNSEQEKDLFDTSKKYGDKGAQLFIDSYAFESENDATVSDFDMAFGDYVQYGKNGIPFDNIRAWNLGYLNNTMNRATALKAWELGANERNEALKAQEPLKLGDGSVSVLLPKAKTLNKNQEATVQVCKMIARVTGLNIEVFESKVVNGKRVGENGSYASGKVRIDIEAGNNDGGSKVAVRALTHELTHYLKDAAPSEYEALREHILAQYGAGTLDMLVKLQQNSYKEMSGKDLSRENAIDEVIADACVDMLRDSRAINELAEKSPSLIEKIKEFIAHWVKKIKDAYADIEADTLELAALKDALDDFTEIQKLWDNAFKAIQRGESGGVKADSTNTFEGDAQETKYQSRKSEAENLGKQNEKQEQLIKTLKEEFRLSGEPKFLRETAEKACRKFLKETGSKMDLTELTDRFIDLGESLANSKTEFNYEDFMSAVYELSGDISDTIDRSHIDPYNSEVLADIRQHKFSLSEQQKAKARYAFGSVREFIHQIAGYATYATDAPTLEVQWSDLVDTHPGIFSDEVTDVDMPSKLVDIIDRLSTPIDNAMDSGDLVIDTSIKLLETFESTAFRKTFADKKKEQRERLEARFKAQIKELRESNKEAILRERLLGELNKKEAKERGRELAEKLRGERDSEKQNRIDREKERRDSTAKNKLIHSIETNAAVLSDWLINPKEGKSVPKPLAEAVKGFISSLNYEKGTVNRKGEPIQHDIKWRERALALENVLIRGQEDYDVQLPEALIEAFGEAVRSGSGESVYDLDRARLEVINDTIKALKHAVTSVNKLHSEIRKESISELAKSDIDDWGIRGEARRFDGSDKLNGLARTITNFMTWEMYDSFTYAERLGGHFEDVVFKNIRRGLDKQIVNTKLAVEYFNSITKGADWEAWSNDKHTLTLADRTVVNMTTAQLMGLYLTAKRPQGLQHILGFGIIADTNVVKKFRDNLRKNKSQEMQAKPVKIDLFKMTETRAQEAEEIYSTISDSFRNSELYKEVTEKGEEEQTKNDIMTLSSVLSELTEEQKKIADALQVFLANDCAKWGNEVTQTLYLFDAYTEKNYYPISVSKDFVATTDKDVNQASLYALKNMSFTKGLVKGANNPIVVSDVFDVWAEHAGQMATYNALTVPLQDAMRYFNFKENLNGEAHSVKNSINRAYGAGAANYFVTLIRDINGMTPAGGSTGIEKLLISNAKAASIAFNLRVVIQQPTAYVRAAAEIDPKYLAKAVFKGSNVKLAKEYCPIAWWKTQGHYETDISRSTKDTILNKGTTFDKVKDIGMKGAEKADALTWGVLWNAVELEVKDKTPGLSGEELYKAVGERLGEIIDKTQVVDSVLHRVQASRSLDMKIRGDVMSFMSEPMKQVNMLMRAFLKKGGKIDRAYLARTSTALLSASVLNAIVKSIIDALRDEDEDENIVDKYTQALFGNITDDVNPFNNIPYVRDIISVAQGYTGNSISDGAIISAYRAFKSISSVSENKDMRPTQRRNAVFNIIYNASNAISQMSGVGVSNLIRDAKNLYNALADKNIGATVVVKEKVNVYINSALNGKRDAAKKVYDRLIEEGYSERQVENSIKAQLVENKEIQTAAKARSEGKLVTYNDTVRRFKAKGFNESTVIGAVEQVINSSKESEPETSAAERDLFKTSDVVAAIKDGSITSAKLASDYILEAEKKSIEAESPENAQTIEAEAKKSVKSKISSAVKSEYYECMKRYKSGNGAAYNELQRITKTLKELELGYSDADFTKWNKGYADWLEKNS